MRESFYGTDQVTMLNTRYFL